MQSTHVALLDAPAVDEYVPAEQLLHLVDPSGENDPAQQSWHSADADAAVEVENEPELQLKHDTLLDACRLVEYAPTGQAEHIVANSAAKVPAVQFIHAADEVAPGVAT